MYSRTKVNNIFDSKMTAIRADVVIIIQMNRCEKNILKHNEYR